MCVFVSASWLWLVTAERTLYQTFCPQWALARLYVVLHPCWSHSRGDSMWLLAVFLPQIHTSRWYVWKGVSRSVCVCSGLLLLFILTQMPIVAKPNMVQHRAACVCVLIWVATQLVWADAADKDLCQFKEQQMMSVCVFFLLKFLIALLAILSHFQPDLWFWHLFELHGPYT